MKSIYRETYRHRQTDQHCAAAWKSREKPSRISHIFIHHCPLYIYIYMYIYRNTIARVPRLAPKR